MIIRKTQNKKKNKKTKKNKKKQKKPTDITPTVAKKKNFFYLIKIKQNLQ